MAYIDRNEIRDYPFDGEFYTKSVNEDLPPIEQKEEEVIKLSCKCDITESSHTRTNGYINSTHSVFVPFDKDVPINVNSGDLFRAWQYGVYISGKVVGVFPSQLGGFVCYIQADGIDNKRS